ncbi:MAG: hypothetical protein QM564_08420 [Bergeyella sp.]
MIQKYREQFNEEFSPEKYSQVLDIVKEQAGGYDTLFRVSESPVFLSSFFKQKLTDACESIITQVKNMPEEELRKAIPAQNNVPNDTKQPHFFTIDFGICENEKGEIVPQLIELQAFPTLYCYQRELQNAFCEIYPFLDEIRPEIPDDEYYAELRKLIIGNENPENVILLEIYPEKQKTNIDFYLTEQKLSIKTVCLTKIKKQGNQLFYENNGNLTQIKRIYNRVIFDELDKIENLKTEFDFRDELDVKWVTHPNWFFKVSKYLLPKLEHQYVPKSYYLNEFPEDENLENFVLKPLFSFAGSGINLNPTKEITDEICDKENYILQRKVNYAPLFKDIKGEFSKAEIRLLYTWQENEDRPKLMEYLVRMTKAAMVNVDFNKKDAIWIGGTTAFFEK